ncbi:rhomboid protease ROM4 [Hepatocystis sp. ex Piliocolobus tephrosceles]|nr:rhomboid protease ROM4 [Hepatocystis sp. ex Piliocolobus tephrosceles]
MEQNNSKNSKLNENVSVNPISKTAKNVTKNDTQKVYVKLDPKDTSKEKKNEKEQQPGDKSPMIVIKKENDNENTNGNSNSNGSNKKSLDRNNCMSTSNLINKINEMDKRKHNERNSVGMETNNKASQQKVYNLVKQNQQKPLIPDNNNNVNNKKNYKNNTLNPYDDVNHIKILVTPDDALSTLPEGIVGRRAPLNPLASPILGKYRRKNKNTKVKIKDPRLNNNPLVGRLIVCISTTALLFWVFFFQTIINFNTFNGRCISKVLYPIYTETNEKDRQPFLVPLGYGACEYNLDESAYNRHFIGLGTSDNGWPEKNVEFSVDGRGSSNWDSISDRMYSILGGLNTNYIRNYGELYRLFWAMYLHGGIMHILFNVTCQIQILWMIEPDWGFLRTALLFFISGITGNLLSAVCDPCGVTVGSSGALYGLIGALVTYYIEYWKTIPRPCCVMIFMILVIMFGIFIGLFGYTDNYAHIGGCLGGILYGFATITTVSAADKCTLGERMLVSPPFSWFISEKKQIAIKEKAKEKKRKGNDYRKQQLANKKHRNDPIHNVMALVKNKINDEGRPPCRMKLREWVVRITSAAALIIMWIILFIYLLDESAYKSYTPMGQIKYSGSISCYCCNLKKDSYKIVDVSKLYWCFSNKMAADAYCQK